MLIFALHAAGKSAGVAVLQDDTFLYEASLNTGYTHSERLLPLCTAAFSACGITPADIDFYAPTAGPGSFTGLRIGLATVKGLAFPNGTAVTPVSTLEAAAQGCAAQGRIIAALDARRGEVYWAAFERDGSDLRRLTPDTASSLENIAPLVENCGNSLFFVGEGAELCYTAYKEKTGVQLHAPFLLRLGAGAALAGRRMALAGEVCTAGELAPVYHRLSQAERERAAKQQNNMEVR